MQYCKQDETDVCKICIPIYILFIAEEIHFCNFVPQSLNFNIYGIKRTFLR